MALAACLVASCIQIITFDTRPHDFGAALRCTAHDHGWQPPTLVNRMGEHNNTARMQALHAFFEGAPDDGVFVFADAWDVIVSDPPEVVLAKFARFGPPIVMGAESNMWPELEPAQHFYPHGAGEFQYVNSGLFVGYGWALRLAFQKMREAFGPAFACSTYWGEPKEQADDMRCWHWFHVHSLPSEFGLDQNATIVLNLNDVDPRLIRGSHSRPTYRGHRVSFIHANGNGKEGLRRDATKKIARQCQDRHPDFAAHSERY